MDCSPIKVTYRERFRKAEVGTEVLLFSEQNLCSSSH